MKFTDLGLSPKVLAAVEAAGYSVPTPIQAEAIPHVLARRDVLGIAQTGTGKTAGFVLPMLTLTEKGRARARMPRTLILEPTRELAAQVEENFNKYGINHKLNVALLIGGVSFEDQMRKLDRGADVLIATPGRLLDLFERGRILMNGVEILVIDEADRMLDMGFIPDIERIVKMVPFTRQTLFFSATMPTEIKGLADKFLQNPVKVAVDAQISTAETVTQQLISSPKKDFEKRQVLRDLIDNARDMKNAIIFCNRKRDVATTFRSLEKHEYSVGALHGDMDQRSRTNMLAKFREGEIAILVASDVAARGLDIPNVSHVFNFDVPIHAEDYIHRVGRTGRAGREGDAVTIVTTADKRYVAAIEKLIGKSIDWAGESTSADTENSDAPKPKRSRKKPAAKTKSVKAQDATETQVQTSTPQEVSEVQPTRRTSRPGRRKKIEEVTEVAQESNPDEMDANVPAGSVEAKNENKRRSPRAKSDKKPQEKQHTKEPTKRANPRGKLKSSAAPEGMGDHVPAFIMRSVSVGTSKENTEEVA